MPVALELPSAKTYTAPLEYVAPYQDDHRHPVVNNDTEVPKSIALDVLPTAVQESASAVSQHCVLHRTHTINHPSLHRTEDGGTLRI